jgi:hypothetical protein
MRIYRPPPLSVAQQYLNLRNNPICAGAGDMGHGRLVWSYEAQPTPLSRSYKVRISYRLDDRPEILVTEPDLIGLAGGRRLPHVYQQDPPLLCLYRSKNGDWTPRMRIDETIVPWTALWLFYFEDWLTTSEWKGGGEHPEKVDYSRRRRLH